MEASRTDVKAVGGDNVLAASLDANGLAAFDALGRCDREERDTREGENRPCMVRTPRVASIPNAGVMSRIRTMLIMRRARVLARVLTLTLGLATDVNGSLAWDSTR